MLPIRPLIRQIITLEISAGLSAVLYCRRPRTFWSALPAGLVTVLDVNGAVNPSSPFAPLQVGFQTTLAGLLASGGQEAVVENYHITVAPFCTVAARGFFSQF